MNKFATNFSVKILAAFASFGVFMLVLACGVGIVLSNDADFTERMRANSQVSYLLSLAIYLLIPAILVFILLMAYLIRTTGMIAGQTEVRLAFLDRIYSDLFTGGIIFLALAYFFLFINGFQYEFPSLNSNLPGLLLLIVLVSLPAYFLGLIWFLSICRRIRARVLFRETLIAKILLGIRNLYRSLVSRIANLRSNTGLALLTMLCFGTFLLGNSFMAAYMIRQSFMGFLFAAAVNLAVLVFLCNTVINFVKISRTATAIANGDLTAKVDVRCLSGRLRQHAEVINNIGDGLNAAVAERMKSENFKTELIANVSHDLKTPLTSIINYIDLLKKQPDPTQAAEYLSVLERNSLRLKDLTDDLLDFSKFSTGNIQLQLEKLDIGELIRQGVGEYQEKLATRDLQIILNLPAEPVMVLADGRQIWRILENLLSNVRKYAQQGTRIYIDLCKQNGTVIWITKNTSATPLNISAEALMERFVRGDASRNTEGSGLGLSIARSLAELQQGQFNIIIDGDLFKTVITLPAE